MAKALSCEAQRDAHSLNAEMSSLGTRCQNSYQELQVLQARLQEHFLPAEADVRDAVGLIDHSPILQQNCGEEIQATRKMAEAFLQLEGNIAHVKENSVTGTKDYQQLAIVRGLVRQLALPVRIEAGETVRAPDGLALSSRNGYLSAGERARAPLLHQVLREVSEGLRSGQEAPALEREAAMKLEKDQWQVDYVAVRKAADLQSPAAADKALVVLAAARLGSTRLIDNLEVAL